MLHHLSFQTAIQKNGTKLSPFVRFEGENDVITSSKLVQLEGSPQESGCRCPKSSNVLWDS